MALFRSFLILDSALIYMERDGQDVFVRNILKQDYQLPPTYADTLELQSIKVPSAIHPDDITEAENWLKKRQTKK